MAVFRKPLINPRPRRRKKGAVSTGDVSGLRQVRLDAKTIVFVKTKADEARVKKKFADNEAKKNRQLQSHSPDAKIHREKKLQYDRRNREKQAQKAAHKKSVMF